MSNALRLVMFACILQLSSAKCPSIASSWCLQIDGFDTIILDGNRFGEIGLEMVFKQIAFFFDKGNEMKELDQLLLINNHALHQLKGNAFCDFRFRRIVIHNCTNLAEIESNAFNGTHDYVRQLKIDSIGLSQDKVQTFFESLNTLVNLEELELKNHRIHKIVPYTFRQQKLSKLELDGPINEIDNNAFYYLDNIRILRIFKLVKHIKQHAFDLRLENNKSLDIHLNARLGVVDRGAFTYTRRPLTINLFLNKLINFDPNIYRPILMQPIRHEIKLHGHLKEMRNPCQLLWIFPPRQFKGVVTFENEPHLRESHFDKWRCSKQQHSNVPPVSNGATGGNDNGADTNGETPGEHMNINGLEHEHDNNTAHGPNITNLATQLILMVLAIGYTATTHLSTLLLIV